MGPPKSASLVPNLALGWGPCRNLLEFSVSLLSLMCKPTLYLLPKQIRTLGDCLWKGFVNSGSSYVRCCR